MAVVVGREKIEDKRKEKNNKTEKEMKKQKRSEKRKNLLINNNLNHIHTHALKKLAYPLSLNYYNTNNTLSENNLVRMADHF